MLLGLPRRSRCPSTLPHLLAPDAVIPATHRRRRTERWPRPSKLCCSGPRASMRADPSPSRRPSSTAGSKSLAPRCLSRPGPDPAPRRTKIPRRLLPSASRTAGRAPAPPAAHGLLCLRPGRSTLGLSARSSGRTARTHWPPPHHLSRAVVPSCTHLRGAPTRSKVNP
ncbi:hypothetical protein BS78_03G150100 [Paspalum vaginatum]|nr:hypothetical protein BS78_03G150100 [Paspalum vaginatum]